MSDRNCLFCKILAGDIPVDVVFENNDVLAFRDINPQAPVHILIIPRRHIETINDVREEHRIDIGALFVAAGVIAQQEGIADVGYRVAMNCNEAAGQTVFPSTLALAWRQAAWLAAGLVNSSHWFRLSIKSVVVCNNRL